MCYSAVGTCASHVIERLCIVHHQHVSRTFIRLCELLIERLLQMFDIGPKGWFIPPSPGSMICKAWPTVKPRWPEVIEPQPLPLTEGEQQVASNLGYALLNAFFVMLILQRYQWRLPIHL